MAVAFATLLLVGAIVVGVATIGAPGGPAGTGGEAPTGEGARSGSVRSETSRSTADGRAVESLQLDDTPAEPTPPGGRTATGGVPAAPVGPASPPPLPTIGGTVPDASPPSAFSIEEPADGTVSTSDVATVYGSAPPNTTVVRDVPLWFDQHATANSEGLWLMQVPLAEGINELTFRLGDDRSTERTIRVTYGATP